MPMICASLFAATLSACSSAPSTAHLAVPAAPPPKDDGSASQGGHGGTAHAAALEQLKVSKLDARNDRQNSVRMVLPDAPNWTRVKFWGVPSLMAFRYGKDHHAIVGGWVIEGDAADGSGSCARAFERVAQPVVDAFSVELEHEAPHAFVWHFHKDPTPQIVPVDAVFAKMATLAARERYAAAYAAYPAWRGRCLVVGVAVPAREDEPRARQVRDRFVHEVFPKVEVLAESEPKERY
ncbi:MAG: hypothetical protein IPG50_20210 [Myxococcales bacterium]|nr:hypothetical protein [Myxococcales bacterium]